MVFGFIKISKISKLTKFSLAVIILFAQIGLFSLAISIGKKPAEATDLNVNPNFWNNADLDFGSKTGGVLGGDQFSVVNRNSLYSVTTTNTSDTTEFEVSKSNTDTLYGGWGAWDVYEFVGANGSILRTDDKGMNWTTITSGTSNTLYDADLPYPNNVQMIVGASTTILKSTDWGLTWASSNNGAPAKDYYGIYMVSTTVAIAVGDDGTIIKTSDGGLNWVSKNSTVSDHLRGVESYDGTNIIAVGESGTIVRSTDAGETWGEVSIGITSNNLAAIYFYDSTKGYAVGDLGTILKSTDGGINWVVQTSNTTENLYNLAVPTPTKVNVFGANSTYVKTADSGANWAVNQDPGVNGAIRAVEYGNNGDSDYVVAGDNGSMRHRSTSTTLPDYDQGWSNALVRDSIIILNCQQLDILKFI